MVGTRFSLLLGGLILLTTAVPLVSRAQTAPFFTSSPEFAGGYGLPYAYAINTDDAEASAREIIITNGILPSGISLTDNSDGTASLQGTPTQTGVFSIELTVREINSPFLEEIQSFDITIAKAPLTVTPAAASRGYGQPNPGFSVSMVGFLNGDDETDLNALPTAATTATSASGVGLYIIEAVGGLDANYSFIYQTAQLTITQAMLTATANHAISTYGQALPAFTISYVGFLNDDDATNLDVLPNASTTATGTSGAGSYGISVSGGSDDNYAFDYQSGTLTIQKATLQAVADDQTKVYGSSNPALTFAYSGFVHGDDASDINTQPAINTSAGVATSVGVYPITLNGGSDDNYTFDFTPGQFTITKAPLTITAQNKTRAYGAANPTLTFTYTGFVHGDDATDIEVEPSASTGATAISAVGTYSINVLGGTDDNYSFNYVSGQLSITQAPLQVAVNSASRMYAQPNPTFTFTYTGFLNGDNATDLDELPVASTTAGLSADVGTYAISLLGGADNNYSYSLIAGVLTITKATATVQITNLLQNVNGTPRPVTVATMPVGLSVNILYNGSTTVPSVKGTYTVLATINDINYQGSATEPYLLNGPPVLLSPPTISFNEDSGNHLLNLSVHVDDTEQTETSLQYALISNTNASLFETASLSGFILSLTPAADKYGSATLGVRVTDNQGMTLDISVSVTVLNVQDAPIFTSNPPLLATQNQLYTYAVMATDVDLTDLLTITSSIALPAWLTLINHGNGTATLTGTPREEDIRTHGIALKVADDKGNQANQFFNITVQQAQFPPVFSSSPVLTARENILYSYTATTTDVNGGAITYSATTLPVWLTATSNGSGGFVLSGTPNLTHVFFENGAQEFPVVITATDNTNLSSTQSFSIRVLYENSPPTVTVPITALTIQEDAAPSDIVLTGITDGGEIGQVITIVPTANPAGIIQTTITYQSPQTTATVHVQSLPNMNGSTTLSIRVQDSGRPSKNFVVKDVAITVNPVNDAPAITSQPILRVNPGTIYSYAITATDVDVADVLTFQKLAGPAWLTISNVNSREGLLTGTVPANATDALVRIQARDQSNATNSQEFTLIINKAPVVQSTTAEINEDDPIVFDKAYFQALISDPNPTDGVSFLRITQLPLGTLQHNGQQLALNDEIPWPLFTQITYTPPLDYFGVDAFRWNVSDGLLLAVAPAEISLTISTENDPPEIRNIETTNITYSQGDVGVPISNALTLIDVDNANLMRATVTISQSFQSGTDVLTYVTPVGETSTISSAFNNQTGELLLEGEASKSAYETALRNVFYQSTFLGATENLSRRISIRVADLVSESQTVSRNLTIIRVLPDIELVSAFTPNGDGVNDTWDFSNLIAYTDIEILVFDARGERVFECRDSNCVWDGTKQGKELPPGPYLYTITLEEGRRRYQGNNSGYRPCAIAGG
jgi:gliding motility-associated-like protein